MSLRESSGGSGRPPFNVTLSPNVASLSGLGYSRVVRGSSDHYSREEDALSLPSLASLATPSGYGPQHRYTDTSYASVATSLRVVSPPPSFGGSRAFSLERDSSPNDPLARARQRKLCVCAYVRRRMRMCMRVCVCVCVCVVFVFLLCMCMWMCVCMYVRIL